MAYQKLIISESLELPSGKAAMDMPYSHYRKLARKHGYVKVVRSLGQLAAWNSNKNPELSQWARDFQRKLKKEFGCHESSSVTILEKPGSPYSPISKKIKVTKNHKEISYYACQKVSKEIGLPIKVDESSINPKDLDFNGNLSFSIAGASVERIYKSALEAYDSSVFDYDDQWKALSIGSPGGSVYIILYCSNAKKVDPKKINPTKRKGSEKIGSNINDLIKRRLLKFQDGSIVPFSDKEKIIEYNKEFWIVPINSEDEKGGGVEYTFKDNPKPQIVVKMK